MLGLILTATLISVASAQTCAYSSICSDHTMCKYPTTDYGASCLTPVYSGVTNAADKQAALDAHNNVRRKVAKGQETRGTPGAQPAAANMRKLVWDEELATVAQRWANQCTFQHDTCRSVARFYVGQNLYITYTKGVTPSAQQNWTAAVQSWYDEVKDFNKANVSPFQYTSGTGHYTQAVWADTTTVGCGFTGYSTSDGWYSKLYACNYGPGGNVVGGSSSMYKTGAACSACPTSAAACDDGLCV